VRQKQVSAIDFCHCV